MLKIIFTGKIRRDIMEPLTMKRELFLILEDFGAARCGVADLSGVPETALPPAKGPACV